MEGVFLQIWFVNDLTLQRKLLSLFNYDWFSPRSQAMFPELYYIYNFFLFTGTPLKTIMCSLSRSSDHDQKLWLVLGDPNPTSKTLVRMLGTRKHLKWTDGSQLKRGREHGTVIHVPAFFFSFATSLPVGVGSQVIAPMVSSRPKKP